MSDLSANRDRVLKAFALPASLHGCSYAPGKWTVHQLLIHIADVESLMLDRVRRILAQDRPLLMAMDPDRWTERLGHRDLVRAASLFAACRDTLLELTDGLSEADRARVGIHSAQGLLTVAQIVEKAEDHAAHHLEQIESVRAAVLSK